MSKVKARAVEALLGAGLGAGAGAVGGRLAYRTKTPLEWSGEDGTVHDRTLSPEERQARRQLIAQSALAAAGVGAAATLGGSLFRRANISKLEREAAQDLGETYLGPLQDILEQARSGYHAAGSAPAGTESTLAKQMMKRVKVTSELLREQEKAVTDLLDTASDTRSAKPFGGLTWSMRGGERVNIAQGSHQDLVKQHFDQLAKAQGLQSFNLANRYDVFENAIHRGLQKQAFRLELHAILEGT